MIKVEIFYNSAVDEQTPELAETIKYKFGSKVNVTLHDTSDSAMSDKYGTINPPEVVIDGKKRMKITGTDDIDNIASMAIF